MNKTIKKIACVSFQFLIVSTSFFNGLGIVICLEGKSNSLIELPHKKHCYKTSPENHNDHEHQKDIGNFYPITLQGCLPCFDTDVNSDLAIIVKKNLPINNFSMIPSSDFLYSNSNFDELSKNILKTSRQTARTPSYDPVIIALRI